MSLNVLRMTDQDLAGKRVLIREDLNVPVSDGVVTSDARIRAALPSLKSALEAGAAVMVCSHLGRPEEGESAATQPEYSLAPVAARLSELLEREVPLVSDWLDGVVVAPGQLVLLENVRWNTGEKKDDEDLAQRMAALCDVFVMDAFGTAHRAQASTHGVARFAPLACAGPLLVAELEALHRALAEPARPLVAIVGGSKVSTKLQVLDRLAEIADRVIVGGGIANTFIAAAGHEVGESLHEADLVDEARRLASKADFPVPVDVGRRRSLCRRRRSHDQASGCRGRRRDDPGYRSADCGAAFRCAGGCRHHSLERAGGGLRVRCVQWRNPGTRRGHRIERRLLDRGRWRYAGSDRSVRTCGPRFLHLDWRRSLPRVRGRAGTARRCGARVPRHGLSDAGGAGAAQGGLNMTVYVVARITIEDRERYREYEAGFMEIFTAHGGELLAVDEALGSSKVNGR